MVTISPENKLSEFKHLYLNIKRFDLNSISHEQNTDGCVKVKDYTFAIVPLSSGSGLNNRTHETIDSLFAE